MKYSIQLFNIYIAFALLLLVASNRLSAQVDFWQPTNGPYGGEVNVLAIDASGQLFAGTNDGIFRSIDSGNDWVMSSNGLPEGTLVAAIAINDSSGHIFAGTGERIFRSTDNGENWTELSSQPMSFSTLALNTKGDIFAGGYGHLARSSNNGESWEEIGRDLFVPDDKPMPITIDSSGTILVGAFDGVFRSSDNGDTWTKITESREMWRIQSLAINAEGHIFAGRYIDCDVGGSGLFVSRDNGLSWQDISDGKMRTINSIAVGDSANVFVATFDLGVFRSIDNGESWTQLTNGLPEYVKAWSLVIDDTGVIFAATHNGIYSSTDNGESWQVKNNGLTKLIIHTIATYNDHIFAGSHGLHYSADAGNTWAEVQNVPLYSIPASSDYIDVGSLAINEEGHIFVGASAHFFCMFNGSSTISRSKDYGNSWEMLTNGLPRSDFITAVPTLAINANSDIFSFLEYWSGPPNYTWLRGVFRSTDNGENWQRQNNGLEEETITSFAFGAPGYVFAGAYGSVYRATNNGELWSPVLRKKDLRVRCLASHANDYVFAGTDSGIYRSTNSGATWVKLNNSLSNLAVFAFTIISNEHIFVGTSGGVFHTEDYGESWIEINHGLNTKKVISLAANSSGYLFAGTESGVYRSTFAVAVAANTSELTQTYILFQNYPNPFNPTTTIEFSLPKPSFVTLKIHDLLGREVATLTEAQYPAGNHKITWEAENNVSGVYLVSMQAGAFRQTRKMVLMR